MSPRPLRLSILALMCASLMSCAVHFNAETLGIRATVSEPAGETAEGQEFDVSRKAVFLFWGVFAVAKPSLEDALAGQLIDGSEIAGLKVYVRSRFGDLLVTALTLGVVVPRSVTFSGTVVNEP